MGFAASTAATAEAGVGTTELALDDGVVAAEGAGTGVGAALTDMNLQTRGTHVTKIGRMWTRQIIRKPNRDAHTRSDTATQAALAVAGYRVCKSGRPIPLEQVAPSQL